MERKLNIYELFKYILKPQTIMVIFIVDVINTKKD